MSPNPFSQKVKIYTWSAAALTAIAILLRIYNFIFHFDTAVDYFDHTPPHITYRAICVLTVAWLLTSLLFIPRYSFSTKTRPQAGTASRITGGLCACTTAASFFFFRSCMMYHIEFAELYHYLAVFSLISVIFFALQAIGSTPPAINALAGYLAIVWLGMILCATYLDLFVAMNSPFKITLQMALLSIMLHLIEDARLQTDHSFRIHYLTYTLIGIFLCGVASVPVLIAYALKVYHYVDHLFYAALAFIFFLYLCTRAHDCYRLLMITPTASQEEIEAEKEKKNKDKKKDKKDSKNTSDNDSKGDDEYVS